MKNFFLSSTLFSSALYSQVTLLTPNGSFENGSPLPTKTEQLAAWASYATISHCTDWSAQTLSQTCDWYTIQNYPDAMQGTCPINNNVSSQDVFNDIINATPKITSIPDGSFYAGCGNHETMTYELIQNTCKHGRVKLSFWFALRSSNGIPSAVMNAALQKSDNTVSPQVLFTLPRYAALTGQALYPVCQWNYYETDWIDVDEEYDELIFGNGDPNNAGGFTEIGYTYVDDIRLYSGCSCCPDHTQYENTASLPSNTVMDNFIRAGFDAGVPNTSGNVIVLNGQNVTFKAGNQIVLEPGFSTQSGAVFNAIIEECSPLTHPTAEPISVDFIPNVFTPNGDGVNDFFCIKVYGADEYHMRVFDRFGLKIYDAFGGVESNFSCVWDGTCNQNCSGYVCNDTYDFILDFFNCKNGLDNNPQYTIANFVTVLGSPCRLANSIIISPSQNHIEAMISPNPNLGVFTLHMKENILSDVFIYNTVGENIYKNIISDTQIMIDLSSYPKGIYYVKVKNADKIYTEKIIIQ